MGSSLQTLYDFCLYNKDKRYLLDEWDYTKNNIQPDEITIGSNLCIFWKCSKGHLFEQRVSHRVNGSKCPYCSGKKLLKGYNDLCTTHPNLLKEWDFSKNTIRPDEVSKGSDYKVWWVCNKGHSFEQLISSRAIRNCGCPYCSGKKVLRGYNDFATLYPNLLKEWDFSKNIIKPEDVSKGSHEKVWWKCDKGHSFQQMICSRTTHNIGCPYCSNNSVLVGYNDLETWCLNNDKTYLLREWDYEKNNIKPSEVVSGSTKKLVWWKCEKGHKWRTNIFSRTKENTMCPYCSNNKYLKGYNDLETWCINNDKTYLLKEWNYEKNSLSPNEVHYRSKEQFWWKCKAGHNWKTSINTRYSGSGCPYCFSERQTSFSEQVIYFYTKQIFPDTINSYVIKQNSKIDIFIPTLKLGIEYDGQAWHQDLNKDIRKNNLCMKNGIRLIRIREDGCPKMKESEYIKIIHCKAINTTTFDLNSSLIQLFNMLEKIINKKINININIDNDRNKIYLGYKQNKYEKSLEYLRPDLLREWDYELNKDISPSMFTLGSGTKVHWICPLGHKYMATIQHRALRGTKCPYCNGKKVLVGFNDFATFHKDLLKYWDYEKNDFNPTEITKRSNKKIWFKKNGKSYYTTIDNFIGYL